jgi:hypothetical protein
MQPGSRQAKALAMRARAVIACDATKASPQMMGRATPMVTAAAATRQARETVVNLSSGTTVPAIGPTSPYCPATLRKGAGPAQRIPKSASSFLGHQGVLEEAVRSPISQIPVLSFYCINFSGTRLIRQ